MLHQDLQREDIPVWGYFCQISDSTTRYGSYSVATPNEKFTWDKLTEDTPMFVVESDATIVAPMMLTAPAQGLQYVGETATATFKGSQLTIVEGDGRTRICEREGTR